VAKRNASSLDPGLRAFSRGDYVEARAELEPVTRDQEVSESRRAEAQRWIEATRVDRGTLLVGLACIALFVLVVIFAILKQPH
jgi:hypothetical protein